MKQPIVELEINISTLHFLIETSKSGEKVISKCQKLLMSLIDVPTAQWGQYLHPYFLVTLEYENPNKVKYTLRPKLPFFSNL